VAVADPTYEESLREAVRKSVLELATMAAGGMYIQADNADRLQLIESDLFHAINNMAPTAADLCRGYEAMERHLEKIEEWEAAVLMNDAAWHAAHGFEVAGRDYDHWIELQRERNELLGR
jgi:hypothetical protein